MTTPLSKDELRREVEQMPHSFAAHIGPEHWDGESEEEPDCPPEHWRKSLDRAAVLALIDRLSVPDVEGLRELSDAASDGPWQWLDGEDEGDELQDGHGEMVATGFRENIVLAGKPLNRDGSFAAACVNEIRRQFREHREEAGGG